MLVYKPLHLINSFNNPSIVSARNQTKQSLQHGALPVDKETQNETQSSMATIGFNPEIIYLPKQDGRYQNQQHMPRKAARWESSPRTMIQYMKGAD